VAAEKSFAFDRIVFAASITRRSIRATPKPFEHGLAKYLTIV